MKFNLKTLILFFALAIIFKVELASQTVYNSKIHLSINNLPNIQHKVITGKNSYKIDNSPTLTYKLPNDAIAYEIKLQKEKINIYREFENDTLFLKVRYNPGKTKTFILRKGDVATVDYIFDIPYLTLKNRNLRKNDEDILKAINNFKENDERFRFLDPFYKDNKEKEDKKSILAYNNIIKSLDSLSKENLISHAEYIYYKKYFTYKKEIKANNFNEKLLKEKDLHIDSYVLYLRQYVFGNLKKKIISLGNGMARNSLESFDFVYANNNFSENNKSFLLRRSLKNIKLDFPKSTYKNRKAKFESIYPNKLIKEINNEALILLNSVSKLTNNVLLVDSKENATNLKNIINQNKGKVIFVDFWTSWCAPCRQAFPSYNALRKEYSKEQVLFLFISGDSDYYKWKKAEQKEKLTNSYLATNFAEAKFYDKLNLRSFPRYLFFNKKGQLTMQRAPGPDSDNIRGFINELLKE